MILALSAGCRPWCQPKGNIVSSWNNRLKARCSPNQSSTHHENDSDRLLSPGILTSSEKINSKFFVGSYVGIDDSSRMVINLSSDGKGTFSILHFGAWREHVYELTWRLSKNEVKIHSFFNYRGTYNEDSFFNDACIHMWVSTDSPYPNSPVNFIREDYMTGGKRKSRDSAVEEKAGQSLN